MEWDIGEPWYRPTRVNHVISGAEFGFRNGSGKWPDYYIDSFGRRPTSARAHPPASPSDTARSFPQSIRTPSSSATGASESCAPSISRPRAPATPAKWRSFISGQPFPVTDFVINPKDGVDVFRRRRTRRAVGPLPRDLRRQRIHRAEPARRSRSKRSATCATSWKPSTATRPGAVETVWPYLGTRPRASVTPPALRSSGRTRTMARKSPGEKEPRKAIAALVALARVSSKDEMHRQDNVLSRTRRYRRCWPH